jgi:hypothetical protein
MIDAAGAIAGGPGVSKEEAHEKLLAYEWEERRFPKSLAGLKSLSKE